ncbi:hypothetical protein VPH35_115992 [Triticum aestivum]
MTRMSVIMKTSLSAERRSAYLPSTFQSPISSVISLPSRWKKDIRPKCEFCDVDVQILQFIRPDGRRRSVQPTHLKRHMQSHLPEACPFSLPLVRGAATAGLQCRHLKKQGRWPYFPYGNYAGAEPSERTATSSIQVEHWAPSE